MMRLKNMTSALRLENVTSAEIICLYKQSRDMGNMFFLSFFKLFTINSFRKLTSYYSWGKRWWDKNSKVISLLASWCLNSISNEAVVGGVILNAVLLRWIMSFLVFIIFILIEYSTLILIYMNLCNHLQLR